MHTLCHQSLEYQFPVRSADHQAGLVSMLACLPGAICCAAAASCLVLLRICCPTDFGLAVFFDPGKLPRTDLGLEGTPWYMAPEVCGSACVWG